ncbi:nodulation protein NfeD [Thermodesulfobacterium sp. TA1]|uniref:NfeD family protein n=1 Tax=Thermodesulfobacterium sp. TA1 TaxID=2234087 RepID=UPI001231B88A|nr:nodulation protein NfeD [Thermodesulfobacterium sp. TA1]QER41599.1 nodulation protein NfeD [Thermodesulfobacterium sp. TA1]
MKKCFWLVSLILVCLWTSFLKGAETKKVYHVKIDAPITPVIANFISYSIDLANQQKAEAIIIELDTPGGLVESTRDIVKDILQSRVPVIVYVSPSGARAASAGTFILLASHLAAMAPGTHVGAAHPVELTGKADKEVMNKVVNDLVAWAKNLAQMRNRNETFAEEAVRKSKSITENEALQIGVIELIAKDLNDLLNKAHGRQVLVGEEKRILNLKNAQIEKIPEDLKTKILKILTNPNLVYFLLMLGLAGLYFELSHPGSIFPGVLGAVCLILALVGLSIIPVNYAGLVFILLAGVLFFLELQVTSHGLLTLAGVICLFLGSLMLFGKNPPALKVSTPLLYSLVLIFSSILGGITYIALKTVRKKPVSGREGIIGKIGKVLEEVGPQGGKVFVEGEIWQAYAEETIPKGEKVVILEKDGLRLKVKRKDQ